jgi:hypothetical protein
MGRKTEWRRECKRDGTRWFVSASDRRTDSAIGRFRAGYKERAGRLVNDAGMVLAGASMRAPNRCPTCGSGEFTETEILN